MSLEGHRPVWHIGHQEENSNRVYPSFLFTQIGPSNLSIGYLFYLGMELGIGDFIELRKGIGLGLNGVSPIDRSNQWYLNRLIIMMPF